MRALAAAAPSHQPPSRPPCPSRPLQAALAALQHRLPRLPCEALARTGEAVVQLQLRPSSSWWGAYLRAMRRHLEGPAPLPPAVCGAVVWTVVAGGLRPHRGWLRALAGAVARAAGVA